MFGRIATWEGEVVGFTIAVVHPGSWTLAPVCYLEDCRQEGWIGPRSTEGDDFVRYRLFLG